MIKYIWLGLLIISSVIHLAGSWLDQPKTRKLTKPLLLIFILLYYIFSVNKGEISVLLVIALVTSWLGDVLLMPKGDKWFVIGGIAFMLTHLSLIAVYISLIDFSAVSYWWFIPSAILYFGISFLVIRSIRSSTPKKMVAPMYLYLLFNSTMNIFALILALSSRSAGAFVALAGAILFFTSDCTLFLVRYHKNPDLIFKRHFTVMLTYILGEFLITQGVLML